jgi:CheY-like chemotaxis protein
MMQMIRSNIPLLDIKMPKMDSLAVIKHISEDGELRCLPVVMRSVSRAEEDRLSGYDLGANAYIVKPVGFQKFPETARTINLFWQLVGLPGGDDGPN